METSVDTTPCWLNCGIAVIIIIIILVLIAALIIYYLWKRFIRESNQKFLANLINTCEHIVPITYTTSVSKPADLNLYDYNLSKSLMDISFAVGESNCINIDPIANPPGFDTQYRIVEPDPADGVYRMFAMVFTNFKTAGAPGRFLVAFTGTVFQDEWNNDLDFPQVAATGINNYKSGILVHHGFYNVYMSVRPHLWDLFNYFNNQNMIDELYISGHSLGAALSSIAAFDFAKYQPIHYSFASPRTGNVAFANTFDTLVPTSMRIYNIEDIITELPPPIILNNIYCHVNRGIPFNINLGTVKANHMNAYLSYLPTCLPNIAPCNSPS